MKEDHDVFKNFQDSFSRIDGHFHILEERVPVELQMEYFKCSEQMRKEHASLTDTDFEAFSKDLSDPDSTTERKKYLLSMFAVSHEIKAYRFLENYVKESLDHTVRRWAYLALMESRISLESELSDEKQIYISTGLGGKNEKLRFYVLILSAGKIAFKDYQRTVVEREVEYFLTHADCEIERLTIKDLYVELLFLIPVRSDIKHLLDKIIDECNQYGNFLSPLFTITNVKELSEEDIETIINKDEYNKTSD